MYSKTVSITDFLIHQAADVNMTDRDGETALSVAVEGNWLNIVKWLLEHGASTEVNVQGDNLLTVAALSGSTEVLEHLVSIMNPGLAELAILHELLWQRQY